MGKLLPITAAIVLFVSAVSAQSVDSVTMVLEDFEEYEIGGIPDGWQEIRKRSLIRLQRWSDSDSEDVRVAAESGRKFLKLSSSGGVARIVRTLQQGPEWDLQTHPVIEWSWRPERLPEGASEFDKNDVCAAVYVTFSINFFRIPKSIKYTYSSTLPVGTVVDYRRLKVLVVASGEGGLHEWSRISRNVAEDYRRLFGEEPPRYPLAVTLSSDSDTTERQSEADFDDLGWRPVAD